MNANRLNLHPKKYSAEYSALPNNEENMFKNKKRRQKITNYDYRRVIKQFCTSSFYNFIVYLFILYKFPLLNN